MKKRMHLTEKESAIGTWLYVKLRIYYAMNIPEEDRPFLSIPQAKWWYLDKHGMALKWPGDCILCHKNVLCSRCPLGLCSTNRKTIWAVVCNFLYNEKTRTYEYPFTLRERLEACNQIIEAIEKDVPDDYKTQHKEE